MKTLLKVVSIIYTVLGSLGIIGGIILCFFMDEILSPTTTYTTGYTLDALVGSMGIAIGILVTISALFTVLSGIFGILGCHGNKSILTAGLIIVIIGLVFSIGTMIFSPSSGSEIAASFIGYILPILYLVSGFKVRKEL